jgi:hypothetical protein
MSTLTYLVQRLTKARINGSDQRDKIKQELIQDLGNNNVDMTGGAPVKLVVNLLKELGPALCHTVLGDIVSHMPELQQADIQLILDVCASEHRDAVIQTLSDNTSVPLLELLKLCTGNDTRADLVQHHREKIPNNLGAIIELLKQLHTSDVLRCVKAIKKDDKKCLHGPWDANSANTIRNMCANESEKDVFHGLFADRFQAAGLELIVTPQGRVYRQKVGYGAAAAAAAAPVPMVIEDPGRAKITVFGEVKSVASSGGFAAGIVNGSMKIGGGVVEIEGLLTTVDGCCS